MANETANSQRAGEMLQGLFQTVNLFSGIPDAVVQDLKSLAEIVQVNPGTEILRQGEINKSLFFLIVGAVDILVDGGHVASLRRKGDLLGEMSVVTKKPCSATIIAKTPVEMIKIDTEVFRNKIGGSYELFEQVLYRVYSMILTDKINITNQKAKLLEDTLDALSRAKNDLTQVNEQMERRLAERALNLRSQMDDLLNKKLKELSSSLNEAAKRSSGELQLHINKALSDVSSVSRAISPIVDAFNLEISLKNRNILLAQSEKKPQTIAKMALGGMGVKIHIAGSTDDAILHMQDSNKDLVLIDVGALDLLTKMREANLTVPVLLIINEDLKEHVGQLVGLENVPSIVTIVDDDRGAAVRAISTTVAKLLSPHVFGMERHLSMGVEIQELQVKRSDERLELNKKMREYFTSLGLRESVLDNASVVTEELLMNAIYDAPTDPSGNQIYNMLPRTTVVELKPDEYARLRFGCDGAYLAVSVEDPFGALSPDVLIKYLESCYSGKAGTLQVNKGGAGRGLHQIVEGSELVVFNVRPKRRTEVIALFNMLPGKKADKRPLIQYCVQK